MEDLRRRSRQRAPSAEGSTYYLCYWNWSGVVTASLLLLLVAGVLAILCTRRQRQFQALLRSQSPGIEAQLADLGSILLEVSHQVCQDESQRQRLLCSSGLEAMERVVSSRNRALCRQRIKMAMCFGIIILPLSVALIYMLLNINWHACPFVGQVPPVPLSETFANMWKTTKSFQTWGGDVLQDLGSEPASLRLRIVEVVRALGPVYTEERRQCKHCRHLDRNSFLVSAPGFNQGVFFLIANADEDVRGGVVLDVQAMRALTLLRSLKLEHGLKGKKDVAYLCTGSSSTSRVAFGADSGILLLPLGLHAQRQRNWLDTIMLSLVIGLLGALFLYVASRATAGVHDSEVGFFGTLMWGELSSATQVLADASLRYLGKLVAAENLSAKDLQQQILVDIGGLCSLAHCMKRTAPSFHKIGLSLVTSSVYTWCM